MAKPEIVRSHTGFAIGGTPPFGHTQPMQTIMDEDLTHSMKCGPAAGTPNSCFPSHQLNFVKLLVLLLQQ
ncbi:MAG: hypothetical protein CM15mP49_13410 [Actinomycetota bacterium]|nr:MAG: hypothetical protein CM15mP49_13410 [Actinomycetota bacterium]